ncbi:zinc finger, RanBP2-type containing protein [Tanacetum coccineum]|uniref:Zinc finger, RanBP2-type containing protein n=1 Tax=Tanacetum coccineum TaxID=301880 RepID=A0ABQ4WZU1_9ASTR
MKTDDGAFLFKFDSKEGLDKVLECGLCIICNTPLILNRWTLNVSLKRNEVNKVPVWVKLNNVPVVAYSANGLSLIATQVGKPIMLDAFTSSMCEYEGTNMDISSKVNKVSNPSTSNSFDALNNMEEGVSSSRNTQENDHETGPKTSQWNEDHDYDNEVDEFIFPEGDKFGDKFDIRLKGRDPMDINKMTDTLEPEETGVGRLQLPGKDQVFFRPSERITIGLDVLASAKRVVGSFKVPRPEVSSMMASMDKDVKKSSVAECLMLEVVHPAVHKIKAESTVILVEVKRFIQLYCNLRKSDLRQYLILILYSDVEACYPHHLEVPEVVIISVLGVIHQNMIGVKVGWSQGDILMIRIIETLQNRRLVKEETTEIMILKEADMKLQGELLL